MALFKRAGSPFYWIEFEYRGQRIRRSSGTTNVRKAEAVERKLRSDLHTQVVLGHAAIPEMTIREAVERYITSHLNFNVRKARSAEGDVYLLDALIEVVGGDDVLISSLTSPKIAELRDKKLVIGRKAATINKYLASLRAILRKAHFEWGTLAVMPRIKLLKLNNERCRWLTVDEERALLRSAQSQPHLHDLIVFLLDTGARLREATGLLWSAVNLDCKPRACVTLKNKGGGERVVPLSDRATILLRRLWAARPKGQDRVFLRRLPGCSARKTKPKATPITSCYGAWYTAVEKAKLVDVVIHDLRHTFASRLVQNGAELLDVSKLLGHKSLRMTERYAHLATKNLSAAIDRLTA